MNGDPGPEPSRPPARLLVGLTGDDDPTAIVRAGRRLAERLGAGWTVLDVRTPRHDRLAEADRQSVDAALGLAERLGATAVTVPAEGDAARQIAAFAAAEGVTHIVVGRAGPAGWRRLLGAPLAARLLDLAGHAVVMAVPAGRRRPPTAPPALAPRQSLWRDFAWANAGVAAATVVAAALERMFSGPPLSLVFLAAVLMIASRLAVWPALYASGLSFLAFAFFFAPPYYSLWAVNPDDVFTLMLFLLVATLTGNLAGRLKRQVDTMRIAARTTGNLYELSRKVAAAGSPQDVVRAAVRHVASALDCRALILLPRQGTLEPAAAFPEETALGEAERAAALRALSDGDAAEPDAAAPADGWRFVPLRTATGVVGVMGLRDAGRPAPIPDRRRLIEAMANQVAVAIERARLGKDMEDARVLNEAEHLRAALLSSVSHDLKTPLVSIIGSATALADRQVSLPDGARHALIQAILDEAVRLHRFVQNLLDMTRLTYGKLQINRRWCELGEIISRARRECEKALPGERLAVRLPDDLPELHVDPVLIEHVLVNLLDNAAKHAPAETPVEIAARAERGRLVVTVTDAGPGIPEAEREAVFDQFYRVRGEDRQPAGTGLGLSICRGLVEAHGGRIAISAGPGGGGTRVAITLPLEPVADRRRDAGVVADEPPS